MKRHERIQQRHLQLSSSSLPAQPAAACNVGNVEHRCAHTLRFRTRVVGLRHRKAQVAALLGDQAWALTSVRIQRRTGHEADRNAIAVVIDGHLEENGIDAIVNDDDGNLLGYLPASFSILLSPLLDAGDILIHAARVAANDYSSKTLPSSLTIDLEACGSISSEVYVALDEAALGDLNRQHFTQVIRHARDRFRGTDLVTEFELHSASLYCSLSSEAQSLYVNLLQRKSSWTLYSEQTSELALGALLECSDVIEDGAIPLDRRKEILGSLLPCLTAPELRALFKRCVNSTNGKGNKSSILSSLGRYLFNQRCLDGSPYFSCSLFAKAFGECCSMRCRLASTHLEALVRLYRLQTLNFDIDILSSERLSNLKLIKFVPTLLSSSTPFVSRQQILDLETAVEMLSTCDALLNGKQYEAAVKYLPAVRTTLTALDEIELPQHWLQFHPAVTYCSVVYLLVKALLKLQRYEDCVTELMFLLNDIPNELLTSRRRGKCWARMLLVVDVHLKQRELALSLCELALADSAVDSGSKIALQDRLLRLLKHDRDLEPPVFLVTMSLPSTVPTELIVGRPLNCKTAERSRFFGYDDEVVSVEELALQHYAKEGWLGFHDEGCLIRTLFGLLMWDIIWRQDIPNVFMASSQDAPLDLGTIHFYTSRRDEIETRLRHIQEGMELEKELSGVWMQHNEELCRGVAWGQWTLDQLLAVCDCIDREALAAVFRLLSMNYSVWTGGLPDLALYNPTKKVFRFVEVKGPNDRLSEQQRAWLSRLHRFGFSSSVLKIKPPNKKPKIST